MANRATSFKQKSVTLSLGREHHAWKITQGVSFGRLV